jgi:hypothetical protein
LDEYRETLALKRLNGADLGRLGSSDDYIALTPPMTHLIIAYYLPD